MTVALRYEDEHALLRSEAQRWLTEHHPMAEVRRLADSARGDDPDTWAALAQLGWIGLLVPSQFGGAGLGMTHAAVLLEESGRQLLTSPLLAVMLGALVIEKGGSETQCARYLPDVARGQCVATVAHVEPSGEWRFDATSVLRRNGRLSGEKRFVWAAPLADLFLVPFRDAAGAGPVRVALVERSAPGVQVEPEIGVDTTRRTGRLILRDVPVADDAVLIVSAASVFESFQPRACTLLAAEMIGGAEALLAMTAGYAATRVQFGRPIGSFQAVKHPLVNLLIAVEQARSLVYAAASALDAASPEAELLARMAKAHASDAYTFAGSRAIQFHGGFGFTFECDAHFFLKRAQASRPAFGDPAQHRQWIARALIDAAR
jgi:alkylation response protein AidB-like acyl-CoA dehydrogenase